MTEKPFRQRPRWLASAIAAANEMALRKLAAHEMAVHEMAEAPAGCRPFGPPVPGRRQPERPPEDAMTARAGISVQPSRGRFALAAR